MSQCDCTIPDGGYCERHRMQKTPALVRLCQTRPDYFALWEKRTEWTVDQPSRGLGDTATKVAHALGISQCAGCKKRQATLNQLVPYRAK